MTYEKGGSGAGGVAVKTSAGDTLTLKERLEHHYLTGLATVEATYQNVERVLKEFNKFFKDPILCPQVNTDHLLSPHKIILIK